MDKGNDGNQDNNGQYRILEDQEMLQLQWYMSSVIPLSKFLYIKICLNKSF